MLDDLHWADQSSLRLLEFAVSALQHSSVLLVGTFREAEARTPPLANTLATLARVAELERLSLAGLSLDEVGDYVAAVVGDDADPNLADSLHDRTAGNPFFVAELVRLLQDEGKLGNATTGAPVPEGVRDVLRTRLSRLPEEAISVLTAGAIAGREFDVALVAHVCGIDEDRALDLVEAAWMAGIVDEAHDGLGHFRFSHELVRETLADGLTALRRIRLHRRIGEAIEELHGERNPGFLTECAYHFTEAAPAGDPLKAVLVRTARGRPPQRAARLRGRDPDVRTRARARRRPTTSAAGRRAPTSSSVSGGRCARPAGWATRVSRCDERWSAPAPKAIRCASRERCSASVAAASGDGGTSSASPTSTSSHISNARSKRSMTTTTRTGPVLRCELLARLAVEGYFTRRRERRRALSAEALEMARRIDDPVALTAALASELLVSWAPDNLDRRLALDDELVARRGDERRSRTAS